MPNYVVSLMVEKLSFATILPHEYRMLRPMTSEPANFKGFVVLIEPDEGVRCALETLLRGHGWAVYASGLAAQLELILEREQVTAVVCESDVPDRTPPEILQSCRSREVPVVFMGQDFSLQGAVDMVRGGASDFLEKPFPQQRLLDLLNSLPKSYGVH